MNLTLIKMAERYGAQNFRVVAIKRADRTIIPRGLDSFMYGDLVFIVTKPFYVPNIFALCGKSQYEIKNVVIVGGSRIGVKAASLLEKKLQCKKLSRKTGKNVSSCRQIKIDFGYQW